jgi:hypothetical protein
MPCLAQSEIHRSQPQHGQAPEDLANAFVQMARASHVQLIAELVWPLPKVPTAEGKRLNPRALDDLIQIAPEYAWEMNGNVLHFYHKKLRHAANNPLNLKFSKYTTAPNLSEMKLWFPVQARGLLEGYSGTGGATTGFGDKLLEKDKLKQSTFENLTALEMLTHVAEESPTFYTVLVFPRSSPTKKEVERRLVWQWGSLDEKLQPLYVQPPE